MEWFDNTNGAFQVVLTSRAGQAKWNYRGVSRRLEPAGRPCPSPPSFWNEDQREMRWTKRYRLFLHSVGSCALAVDVPDVRDVLLLEIGVHALADADQAVLVAAGEPEQLQLLAGAVRVGHQLGRGLRVGGRGEGADPGEGVEVGQPEVERLARRPWRGRRGPGARGRPGPSSATRSWGSRRSAGPARTPRRPGRWRRRSPRPGRSSGRGRWA